MHHWNEKKQVHARNVRRAEREEGQVVYEYVGLRVPRWREATRGEHEVPERETQVVRKRRKG